MCCEIVERACLSACKRYYRMLDLQYLTDVKRKILHALKDVYHSLLFNDPDPFVFHGDAKVK